MGEVKIVNKSRKEYKCSKCGKVIPVGSRYYRGIKFREKAIIACDNCKIYDYEVHNSSYVGAANRLRATWTETIGCNKDTISCLIDELEYLKEACEESYDNIPEQLQSGKVGQLLEQYIEWFDDSICELENFDAEEILEDAVERYMYEAEAEIILKEKEARGGLNYEEWFEEYVNSDNATAKEWTEAAKECFEDFVEEALAMAP